MSGKRFIGGARVWRDASRDGYFLLPTGQRDSAYIEFLRGVELLRGEISRGRVGRISRPEPEGAHGLVGVLWKSQRLVGVLAQVLVGFFTPLSLNWAHGLV